MASLPMIPRRWPGNPSRFSIRLPSPRSLFVVSIALIALAILIPAARQAWCVHVIRRHGGEVNYASDAPPMEIFWNHHDLGDSYPAALGGWSPEWADEKGEWILNLIHSPYVCDLWDSPFAITFRAEPSFAGPEIRCIERLPGIRFLKVENATFDPRLFAASVAHLNDLEWLLLSDSDADDQVLSALEKTPNLIWLDLHSTSITDEGTIAFRNMGKLRTLILSETKVTDVSMTALEHLSSLERLELRRTCIGDKGVERMAGLKNLRRLILADTQVTPACLATLAKLPNLDQLDVSGTAIKEADLEQFKLECPKVYVLCEWFPLYAP
jgi:Leucine rich repeat